MSRRFRQTASPDLAPGLPVRFDGEGTLNLARRWGREHPLAEKGCGCIAGEKKKAEQCARLFWSRLRAGKFTPEQEQQVRQRFHEWFSQFALEN